MPALNFLRIKDDSQIGLPSVGPGVELIIVESYKHVGTHCSVSANIRNEICCRVNVMRVESQNLRKVLRKADLPLNRKLHTIQAYILSKGLFQSGSWPQLHAVQYKRVHSCIMKLYMYHLRC